MDEVGPPFTWDKILLITCDEKAHWSSVLNFHFFTALLLTALPRATPMPKVDLCIFPNDLSVCLLR